MSIKVKVYNQKAEPVGEQVLSDKVFGMKAKEALIHQAMVAVMANQRQVLAHTKTRSEVRGGGKKPWRQKGTGRARAGSSRSPIWIGGGVTFGPTNERNFSKKINKKMSQKALCMVLSDKLKNNRLMLIDKIEIDEHKTKKFDAILKDFENKILIAPEATQVAEKDTKNIKTKKVKFRRNLMVINDLKDEKIYYSSRNLKGIKMINLENINILDLLKYRDLLVTASAAATLNKRYSK